MVVRLHGQIGLIEKTAELRQAPARLSVQRHFEVTAKRPPLHDRFRRGLASDICRGSPRWPLVPKHQDHFSMGVRCRSTATKSPRRGGLNMHVEKDLQQANIEWFVERGNASQTIGCLRSRCCQYDDGNIREARLR